MTTTLELLQVSKVYGSGPTEVHALREINLAVESGELVAIMGPSGSGKSTLLTIAGSLELPTSGEVWGSTDEGRTWTLIVQHLPEIYSLEFGDPLRPAAAQKRPGQLGGIEISRRFHRSIQPSYCKKGLIWAKREFYMGWDASCVEAFCGTRSHFSLACIAR